MDKSASPTQPFNTLQFGRILKRAAPVVAVAALFVAGLTYVNHSAKFAYDDELSSWENFLKYSANNDSTNITAWVKQQYTVLSELASNISLQIYMTELALVGKDEVTDEPAQASYLYNLLAATAKREGFDKGGLALLDRDNNVVTATPDLAHPDNKLTPFIETPSPHKQLLIGPYINEKGVLVIAFKVPVYVVQDDSLPSQWIGTIVGVRDVKSGLYPVFRNALAKEATLEPILIKQDNDNVEYYIPNDVTSPARPKYFPKSREELAAIYAMKHPNTLAIKQDRNASKVLAVATKVKATPWYVVRQVSYVEAMKLPIILQFMASIVYCAIFATFVMAVFAIVNVKRKRAFKTENMSYKKSSEALAFQKNAMGNILNALPMAVTYTDNDGSYAYANQKASRLDVSHTLSELSKYYRENWRHYVQDTPVTFYSCQGNFVIKSTHIPVNCNPEHTGEKKFSGILTIEEDVTTMVVEAHMLQQIFKMVFSIAETRINCLKRSKPGMYEVDGEEIEEAFVKKLLWTD